MPTLAKHRDTSMALVSISCGSDDESSCFMPAGGTLQALVDLTPGTWTDIRTVCTDPIPSTNTWVMGYAPIRGQTKCGHLLKFLDSSFKGELLRKEETSAVPKLGHVVPFRSCRVKGRVRQRGKGNFITAD